MQIVEPPACSSSSICITASPLFESRFPVGSSASTIGGRPAIARAIATSCWWPPESEPGRDLARGVRPTRASAASVRAARSAPVHAVQRQRVLDVLVHRHVANQVEALEDQADVDVAHARLLAGRELVDAAAVEPVAPARRRVEQPENRQHRRLAAARRPGDGDVLAAVDVDRDVVERARLLVRPSPLEDLGDPLEPDEREVGVGGATRAARCLRVGLVPSPPLFASLQNTLNAEC